MNHQIARMIVYLYEQAGPRLFARIYFGPIPDPHLDHEKAADELFQGAQKFLNAQGYDGNGSMTEH